METPCPLHTIEQGNSIYYQLFDLLKYCIRVQSNVPTTTTTTYPVKLIQIVNMEKGRKLLRVEVTHNGTIDTDLFNSANQVYYSQMNDDPMWKKIDDNRVEFIMMYQSVYHTVEDNWEPFDY